MPNKNTPHLERRVITASTIHFERREDKSITVEGIAAPYNSDSVDLGYFVERYAPGCFTRTLKERPDIRALVDHDTGLIVGRTTAGNLEMFDTKEGLGYRFTPPDTTIGRDLAYNIENRILTNVSIGFMILDHRWTKEKDTYVRTLLDVELWEMSFVAFPAYPETTAEARDLKSLDLEQVLEDGKRELAAPLEQRQREAAARRRRIEIARRK